METVEQKTLTKKEMKSDILKKFGWCTAFHLCYFVFYFTFAALFFYVITLLWHNCVVESVKMAWVGVALLGILLAYLLFAIGYHTLKMFVFITRAITVLISGFHIAEDTLINSDTQEYNALKRYTQLSKRSHYADGYEEVMYFRKYGRTVNCMLDSYSDDYGAEFYLAVYGRKNRIAKAYSIKKYEIIQ